MELTKEQKRALAVAAARKRAAEANAQPKENAAEPKQDEPAPFITQEQLNEFTAKQSPANIAENLGGAVDAVTQGASFGWGNELTAAESAVLGRTPDGGWFDYGKPFGERYGEAFKAETAQQDAFKSENPGSSLALELMGAAGTGTGLVKGGVTLAGKSGSRLGNIGLGALEGGAYGGLYGAGEADDGDRTQGAAWGSLAGAATGAGGTAIADALLGKAATTATKKAAPTVDALKAQGGAKLEAARQANPAFDNFDDFVMQAYRVMPDEGYHPNLHPKVKVALDRIEELSQGGPKPDYRSLEQLRKLLAAAASSTDPSEKRLGVMLRNGLDDFMESAQGAAMAPVREGRKLWSQAKKAELVQDAVTKAQRRAASTGSGGNVENAIRQNVRAILDNPKKRRGFSADEIEMMENVVRGEPVQNFLRLVGKLSPQGNGLMMALQAGGVGAAGVTGNPLFMAPAALGLGAKTMADRGTMQNAALLDALVRSGGKAVQPRAISHTERALIDALSGQAGGATAP